MKRNEVLDLLANSHNFRDYDSTKFSECDDICVVNDLLALPVILPSSLQNNLDIDIVDDTNQVLGWLCCCRTLGQVDVTTLTDAKYAAYISEVQPHLITGEFIFSNDYVVIQIAYYNEYKAKYLDSSPLWGGFLHSSNSFSLHESYKKSPLTIRAVNGISFPTLHHKRSVAQSVMQVYGFERFLKLYHLVELLFDFDIVKEIQNLGDDMYGIGKILANYEREELERLKSLLRKRFVSNFDDIAMLLNNIRNRTEYYDKGLEIFYRYGKDGNPIKDEAKFIELMNLGGFTVDNLRTLGLTNKDRTYEKLVVDVAAYWIYRIRCSVAHNRIGEYVMVDDDEEFVVECIEPLIRTLLCRAFQ